MDQYNIEVEPSEEFKKVYDAEKTRKSKRDEKLLTFEIRKLNKMMSETKSNSLKNIKNTMSSTKFSELSKNNAFDDTIN